MRRIIILLTLLPFAGMSQIRWLDDGKPIDHPEPMLQAAMQDLDSLTQAQGISITLQIKDADTIPAGRTVTFAGIHFVYYPEHHYQWSGSYPNYTLTSQSVQGLTFGIYGLLDEVLGFHFIHPKQTIRPNEVKWPQELSYSSRARFMKHGFHLHTQHPLELTEQLHNPDLPNAWPDVKEYIDWLVRNRQNYWEWCLLRTVDMDKWQPHAKRMVDYSHQRGLMIGIDVSLHMIQQRTFQLYKGWPKSWRSKEEQLKRSLADLYYAEWDFLNVEFNTAEFVGGKDKLKTRLKKTLITTARNTYHSNIMGRKHVVSAENMVGEQADVFSANDSIDLYRGVGIHTVMMYSLEDSVAPVYENRNFHHIYKDMLRGNKVREVWFYPESAYWVTYDNSVPMLLLPYLSARLSDILLCQKEHVPNHLTFSSGWEWGYWAVDWSIARWSWKSTFDGKEHAPQPMEWVTTLGYSDEVKENLNEQLALQHEYLGDRNLLRFMCAQTVTDELSLFRKQFEPRPDYTFKWLQNRSDEGTRNRIRQIGLKDLGEFYARSKNLNSELAMMVDTLHPSPLSDYLLALQVTTMRAKHRNATINAMLAHREKRMDDKADWLQKATDLRLHTLGAVHKLELNYKYNPEYLYTERFSHTSYPYGYLYAPHTLHFWKREEQQSRKNRWGYNFMSIWKVGRIIGL
ncbi:MAG: hypothetical protein GC178_15490 [Flavobacteriales bacterium]|nr:hypothetical protein [Flavobacteriales bacterium]